MRGCKVRGPRPVGYLVEDEIGEPPVVGADGSQTAAGAPELALGSCGGHSWVSLEEPLQPFEPPLGTPGGPGAAGSPLGAFWPPKGGKAIDGRGTP